MSIVKVLVMSLLLAFLCSCGSTSSSTTSTSATELLPVAKSVEYAYVTPGNGLPEILYSESITISGTTMMVTRTGGAQVNSGSWTINLSQAEISRINDLLSLAEDPTVGDDVIDNAIYDAPESTLVIGGSKTFRLGMVFDPISNKNQYHQYPVQATNLISYIESLMTSHIGNRYK